MSHMSIPSNYGRFPYRNSIILERPLHPLQLLLRGLRSEACPSSDTASSAGPCQLRTATRPFPAQQLGRTSRASGLHMQPEAGGRLVLSLESSPPRHAASAALEDEKNHACVASPASFSGRLGLDALATPRQASAAAGGEAAEAPNSSLDTAVHTEVDLQERCEHKLCASVLLAAFSCRCRPFGLLPATCM